MTEEKYIGAIESCKEMVWIKNFLKDLGMEQTDCALFSDSQSIIHFTNNSTFYIINKTHRHPISL